MIRTLLTLTIGAVLGALYTQQAHTIQELRDELLDRELALDDAETMLNELARAEMKRAESDHWPQFINPPSQP